MASLSSQLLQEDFSKKTAFPFFTKNNNNRPKNIFSLQDHGYSLGYCKDLRTNNKKRLWDLMPAKGKENDEENSQLRKKVKLEKTTQLVEDYNQTVGNDYQKFDPLIWKIDQGLLQDCALNLLEPFANVYEEDSKIQTAFSQSLEESKTDPKATTNDSAALESLQLYQKLKSQFCDKYKVQESVPKFIQRCLSIEGGKDIDQNSVIKSISQSLKGENEELCLTPVGKQHQTFIPKYALNHRSQQRHPPKLVWSPEVISEDNWEAYIDNISKIVGERITKEDVVAQHLVKHRGDTTRAIEEVKKKKMNYRSLFRVCQKNLRSRTLIPKLPRSL